MAEPNRAQGIEQLTGAMDESPDRMASNDHEVAVRALIAKMPKVELHVHLEGCLEPDMALRFALKNGVDFPYDTVEAARRGMNFSDLSSFISAMSINTNTMRAVEDHYEVTYNYLKRLAGENVVHVEMAMSPQGFLLRGLEIKPCIDAVASAFSQAAAEFGLSGGIIAGCMRHRPAEEALDMLTQLRACRDQILAVGLHGAEWGSEPRHFQRHFALARAEGWRTVAHAGKEGPADYVRQALDVLKVERIDHGVRAEEDPALIARLADEQVPLTVCPVSNLYLGGCDRLEDHNIARLLRRGLAVSLHSDDPSYFGGYLSQHFEQTAAALELSAEEVAQLNRNAIGSAFVDGDVKARWLRQTDEALAEFNAASPN